MQIEKKSKYGADAINIFGLLVYPKKLGNFKNQML